MLENKTEEQAKEEILAMVAEYCDKFKAKPPYRGRQNPLCKPCV